MELLDGGAEGEGDAGVASAPLMATLPCVRYPCLSIVLCVWSSLARLGAFKFVHKLQLPDFSRHKVNVGV